MATILDATGWNAGLPASMYPLEQMVTGSVHFFGEGRDVDILLHVDDLDTWAMALEEAGWRVAIEYDINKWFACRKGLVNLLVCGEDHFRAMAAAARVCKKLADLGILKPEDRALRVAVHRAATGEEEQP